MKYKDWFINFDFNGRSRRSHWWANTAAWLAVLIVVVIVGSSFNAAGGVAGDTISVLAGIALLVCLIFSAIDNIAMNFRRAHDTGKSGWVFLLLFIPFVNFVAFYWLMIQDSDAGPNKYGPPQKTFYAPSVEAVAVPVVSVNASDELAKLLDLKERGAITEEEFSVMKAKLLS
jgi:uncharacterized membrane protein YhaH (DUF805 family)